MPLPAGAEVVDGKDGRRVARWRIRGGKLRSAEVLEGRDGRLRVRGETACWMARYRDADGIVRDVQTGCRDETAARAMLLKLERRVERVRAGIVTHEEDAVVRDGDGPIAGHVEAWRRHLALKGTSAAWSATAVRRVNWVAGECGFRRLRDVAASPVERCLARLAERGISAATRNGYRGALVAFMNWAARTGRVGANPLRHVATADARRDPRRQRRALSEAEIVALLDAARRRPLAEAMTVRTGARKGECVAKVAPAVRERLDWLGRERALIYKTLVLTGLRLGELRSLTLARVDLASEPPHATLLARDDKSRRGAEVPIRADLAAELREWLADRLGRERREAARKGGPLPAALPPSARLFDLGRNMLRAFDKDLVFAGLARTVDRDGRKVIDKRDARGRSLDVHALRHTFGTHLSRGGVSLRTAQAAMRHADPSLTANVYTDSKLLDVAGALEALPRLAIGCEGRLA
ncbi:MAG: site-specific integrase [Phycisphaerales bacterium]